MSTNEWSVSGILRLCPADADVNSNSDRLRVDRISEHSAAIVIARPLIRPGRSYLRLPEVGHLNPRRTGPGEGRVIRGDRLRPARRQPLVQVAGQDAKAGKRA